MIPGLAGCLGGLATARSFALTDIESSNSTDTSYTFTAAVLGPEAAGRLIVVSVGATDLTDFTGVTIGGNAMTEVVQAKQSTDPPVSAIYQRVVATGTTADIVVSCSDGARGCAIAVYSLIGLNSTTAVDSDSSAASADGTATLTLTTVAGDFVVARVTANTDEVTYTWTQGVTEDQDVQFGAGTDGSSGAASGVATTTSISPLATLSGAEDHVIVAAAWR